MNDVSTPDKLYRLSVDISYEHGSMRDTGSYGYKVLIPATGHDDANSFAEELIARYQGHHKWRQDFRLSATLVHFDVSDLGHMTERKVKTWSLSE